jgi:hypothetical protein
VFWVELRQAKKTGPHFLGRKRPVFRFVSKEHFIELGKVAPRNDFVTLFALSFSRQNFAVCNAKAWQQRALFGRGDNIAGAAKIARALLEKSVSVFERFWKCPRVTRDI